MKKIFYICSGIICLFLLFLVLFGKQIQTYMSFPAIHINTKEFSGYSKVSLDFEEINFTNSEGNNINGLYVDNKSKKTIYYFHGNGGALPYFYSDIVYLKNLDYNIISYDYPGYGKSEGFPDDDEVFLTSKEFFEFMQKEKGLILSDIVAVGYSVGTAVATDFAFENEIKKLILVAPISSRYDMSKFYFGIVLQKFLFMADSFENYKKIQKITIPTLIIHGNKDKIVPFEGGKKVFNNSTASFKDFITLENFGHNFIFEKQGDFLKPIFKNFLRSEENGKLYELLKEQELSEKNEQVIPKEGDVGEKTIIANLPKDTEIKNKHIDPYFGNDTGMQKFVSPNVSFQDKSYVPVDLVSLESEFIFDQKGTAMMRKEAAENFYKLSEAFYEKFEKKIIVVSSYRSYLYQKGIKDRGCPDSLCSKAGHSEHQSGLAVDLWEATNNETFLSKNHLVEYFDWLKIHAADYGFHNSYQKGIDIDLYEKEPWHWRYLGKELALYLNESKLSFSEFYSVRTSNVGK